MEIIRFGFQKMDIEKVMITVAMTGMEVLGMVFLFCGVFGIRIF